MADPSFRLVVHPSRMGSYLSSLLLMRALDFFELQICGANHAQQRPTFPPRMNGGKDRFVHDDGCPRRKRPDEHRLDRQVAERLEEDTHHLVGLVSPPAIRQG